MPEQCSSLDTGAAVLRAARAALDCDDLILWVRSGSMMLTGATTLPLEGPTAVDMPLGAGFAGSVAEKNEMLIVDDFHDQASMRRLGYGPRQPSLVELEGWRSAAFVPLGFPRNSAVVAAYSSQTGAFTSMHHNVLTVWGERALLRIWERRQASRAAALVHFYDLLSQHIHDIGQNATTALMAVEAVRDGVSKDLGSAVKALRLLERLAELPLRAMMDQRPVARRHDIGALVEAVIDEFQPRAHEKGVRLTLSREEHCPGVIDQYQFKRALINLLANSLQQLGMIQRDKKLIQVRVWQGANYTMVSVTDNGPGIQEDRVARIFDPGVSFSQNGFGLGLAQVEAALATAEGFVNLTHNEFGEGCTFTLHVPYSRRWS